MPSTCTTAECTRTSCALCHCCRQDLCLYHLKEHQEQLISLLDPLVDRINILDNRVNTFDINLLIGDAQEKLERWRLDCYKKIDQFLQEKHQQLTNIANEKIERQRAHIESIRSKMIAVVEQQEVTRSDINSFASQIDSLEKQMFRIEQTSFTVFTQSTMVDENLIRIDENNPYQFELSSLSPASKTLHSTKDNWAAVATNETVLLICRESHLCLVDQQLNILKKAVWSFGEIWDMFWSDVLKRFIVINENSVFLVDEETMSIESIQMGAKQNWCCGTCSNKSLFLATYRRGSSIMEFNLFPTMEFVTHWKTPNTCSKDEGIHDMIYRNEQLFLIIENRVKNTVRMELKSSITFDRLWSVPLESVKNPRVQIRCCLLNDFDWIIAYHDLSGLLHIDKDGELKASLSYSPAPHFALKFGSNLLVIATSKTINLHQLI